MGDIPHVNFGDYERLNNLEEEISNGFLLVNPVTIEIKNSVLTSTVDNQFSCSDFCLWLMIVCPDMRHISWLETVVLPYQFDKNKCRQI